MTRVPDRPLQAFTLFPFETWISVAMVSIGLCSAFTGSSASTVAADGLRTGMLIAWQFSVFLAGAAILYALLARPWAARRLPPVRAQRTLATLRGLEAAGCVSMATGATVYAALVALRPGATVWGTSFIVAAMMAIAAGYASRARSLNKANSRILHDLREFNATQDADL